MSSQSLGVSGFSKQVPASAAKVSKIDLAAPAGGVKGGTSQEEDQMSKTLEAWGIKFQSRHAYTRNELSELIQSIDS
jgi:hypothetical protein